MLDSLCEASYGNVSACGALVEIHGIVSFFLERPHLSGLL